MLKKDKGKNPLNNETYTLVAFIGSRVLKRDSLSERNIHFENIIFIEILT